MFVKRLGSKNVVSLRQRFKLFAGALIVVILLSAAYGYQRLSTTQSTIEANLIERNSLLQATHILRASLLDAYQAMDSFLLDPTQSEHRESINWAIRDALLLSKQLADSKAAVGEDDKRDFRHLNKTLLKLEVDIGELIEIRLEPSRQYPSLGIGAELLQPNRNRVNNAFSLALNALKGEERLDENPEVLGSFLQARHLWSQMLSNFRLYLANRMGSFNEDSLPVQENGIATMYGEYKKEMEILRPLVDEGIIGFETSEAYEELLDAADKWFGGFQKVKVIHSTNEWRIDAKLMKENISPSIELASIILRDINDRLVLAAENDTLKLGDVASLQSIVLWIVAAIAILFVISIVVSIEKLILIPVGMIAKALKQEALGKARQKLPTFYSSETKDLIEAFGEMSRQIHSRQSELEYRALHDGLTSLPNRTLLFDHIEHDIFIARRDEAPLTLLMLDLDLFKEVNDTFGHAVGDQLLIEVGKRLKSLLRDVDTVARMGGDEFSIILPGVGGEEVAAIANKLIRASQLPYEVDDMTLVVAASIGVAIYPEHGEDGKNLLQHADVAMYVAKQNKLGYSIYDPEQDQYSLTRFSMIADLRDAIENNSLELYFQPKLDLRSHEVVGVEALLRWNHLQHGFVSPEQIVELAEQTGFISQLTYWVAERAIQQASLWHSMNINLNISINISAHNLKDEGFVAGMKKILELQQLPCDQLTLEITENAMMSNPMLAVDTLTEFSNMGFGISVDDYGTGFSSLSYLSKLPVDELKIDKSFVINIDTDPSNETIVRSTIELAHNLGLNVVAEGIETQLVWNMLRSYGCDQAQGYLMSKPVPAPELELWLSQRSQALA